jgi:hypothetical protein
MNKNLVAALMLFFLVALFGWIVSQKPVRAEPVSTHTILPLEEQRYCGVPHRDADGTIHRNTSVIAAFKRQHPCPVNGKTTGACGGWAIDHVIPLACGGCDAVSNMQWLPNGIKSAPTIGKDRFERLIYCEPFQTVK